MVRACIPARAACTTPLACLRARPHLLACAQGQYGGLTSPIATRVEWLLLNAGVEYKVAKCAAAVMEPGLARAVTGNLDGMWQLDFGDGDAESLARAMAHACHIVMGNMDEDPLVCAVCAAALHGDTARELTCGHLVHQWCEAASRSVHGATLCKVCFRKCAEDCSRAVAKV